MSINLLHKWETQLRSLAKADGYTALEKHIEQLSEQVDILPGKPERLLEGTVLLVRACFAYWSLDGQVGTLAESFFASQRYGMPDPKNTGYTFTFDLHSMALARVVIDTSHGLSGLDLADLYGHPWWEYQRIGYDHIYIARSDWASLTSQEVDQLEEEVTEDIRYDYSEDELDLWFEQSLDETCLKVSFQDRGDDI